MIRKIFVASAFAALTLSAAAQAAVIPVVNAGFENPNVGSGGYTSDYPSAIPSWTGAGTQNADLTGGSCGVYAPGGVPEGINIAYINLNSPGTGYLTQTLSDVLGGVGSTYDLSVDIQRNKADGYKLILSVGATQLQSVTYTYDSNVNGFATLAIPTYTVQSGDPIGGALTIRLEAVRTSPDTNPGVDDSAFQQAWLDKVQMSANVVPEPASLGLLAIAGTLLMRRRK